MRLPSGGTARIRALRIQFPPAISPRLPADVLSKTYVAKPLVTVDGDAMFGELAILRLLEKDGWVGVWVDTFHQRKFWQAMPHASRPVALPPAAQAKYAEIVTANGKAGGFFDVMAWREERFLFVEYKGSGDRANANERRWIAAALTAGVREEDLAFVLY